MKKTAPTQAEMIAFYCIVAGIGALVLIVEKYGLGWI